MRRSRYVPCGLILAAVLGITAALAHDTIPPAPLEDPDASAIMDRALETWASERVLWLDCKIRQKVDLPDLHYTSEGRYLLAPGQRFRLEVQTRTGELGGTLLWVSDGETLWQATRAGAGPWESVTRLSLSTLLASLADPASPPPLRAEFLSGPNFAGVGPQLRVLRTRLVWIQHARRRAGEAELLELTAVWPGATLNDLAPTDRPWPLGLPRQCRVLLDARALWPHAVEWWGPGTGDTEALLARTEYLSPAVNRPMAEEACARAFAFDPQGAAVADRTGRVTADLAARAQQLGGSLGR